MSTHVNQTSCEKRSSTYALCQSCERLIPQQLGMTENPWWIDALFLSGPFLGGEGAKV